MEQIDGLNLYRTCFGWRRGRLGVMSNPTCAQTRMFIDDYAMSECAGPTTIEETPPTCEER